MTTSVTIFPDWIAHQAQVKPRHIALAVDGKEWTFAELDSEITSVARRLLSLGADVGDKVATLLHNGLEMAIMPFATLRIGATLVPLNVRLSESELAWQLCDSMPRVLIVDGRTRERALVVSKRTRIDPRRDD